MDRVHDRQSEEAPPGRAAIPAATLVLFRPTASGAPELLMLERAGSLRFAGGAMVFPGGRIDPGDLAIAGGEIEAAARIAAVRETIEEAGVPVCLDPLPDRAAIDRIRDGLLSGRSFADLLAEAGCRIDADGLIPFARWRPPDLHVRVFDTRFYLAEAPAGVAVQVDGGECVDALWTTAAGILAEQRAGRRHIIYPTLRNLERLAQFRSFAEAAADARARPVTLIEPQIVTRDGADWLTIPEGIGYPVTAERVDEARRS